MRIALALAFAITASGPALALDCYEDIGCMYDHLIPKSQFRQLSCQNLWYVRNNTYDDHGYCFATARGQAEFDNSDCSITNAANVPLNSYERKNIGRIKEVEAEKGCPR